MLKAQLDRIANATQKHKRVSLIFDEKEASQYDADTIRTISLNGFMFLETLDPSLSRYRLLYAKNPTSNDLHATIKEYLRALIKHVLLKPTQKALEYLVQHHQVHTHLAADFMAVFVPYRSTPIYEKALSLVGSFAFDVEFVIPRMRGSDDFSRIYAKLFVELVYRKAYNSPERILMAAHDLLVKSPADPSGLVVLMILLDTLVLQDLNAVFAAISKSGLDAKSVLTVAVKIAQTQEALVVFPENVRDYISAHATVVASLMVDWDCARFLKIYLASIGKFEKKEFDFFDSIVTALGVPGLSCISDILCSRLDRVEPSEEVVHLLAKFGKLPTLKSSNVAFKSILEPQFYLQLKNNVVENRHAAVCALFEKISVQDTILPEVSDLMAMTLDEDNVDILTLILTQKKLDSLLPRGVFITKLKAIIDSKPAKSVLMLALKWVVRLMESAQDSMLFPMLADHLFVDADEKNLAFVVELTQFFVDTKLPKDKQQKVPTTKVGLNSYILSLIVSLDLDRATLKEMALGSQPTCKILATYALLQGSAALDHALLDAIVDELDDFSINVDLSNKNLVEYARDEVLAGNLTFAPLLLLALIVERHQLNESVFEHLLRESNPVANSLLGSYLKKPEAQGFLSAIWIRDVSPLSCCAALKLGSKLKYSDALLCALQSKHAVVRKVALESVARIAETDGTLATLVKQKTMEIERDPYAIREIITAAKKNVHVRLLQSVSIEDPLVSLSLLQLCHNVDHPYKIQTVSKCLESLVKALKESGLTDLQLRLLKAILSTFTAKSFTSAAVDLTKSCLFALLRLLKDDASKCTEWAASFYAIFYPGCFDVLDAAFSKSVVIDLFTLAESSRLDNQLARSVLINCDLKASIVGDHLSKIISVFDEVEGVKKVKVVSTENSEDSGADLTPLVTLMEVLHAKTGSKDSTILVPVLFESVTLLISNDATRKSSSYAYTLQLVLSFLDNLINISTAKNVATWNESLIRADVIVQCVRNSDAETRNHALRVISSLMKLYPQKVLLNIMPVFTFMGTNMLQVDDSSSFALTEKLINLVVPGMTSLESQDTIAKRVRALMFVFTNAFTHIPEHRRLHLFKVLVRALSPEKYFGLVSCLIIIKNGNARLVSDFLCSLCRKFPAAARINALVYLVDFVRKTLAGDSAALQYFELRDEKRSAEAALLVMNYISLFVQMKENFVCFDSEAGLDLLPLIECLLGLLGGNVPAKIQDIASLCIENVLAVVSLDTLPVIMKDLIVKSTSKTQQKTIGILRSKIEGIEADNVAKIGVHFDCLYPVFSDMITDGAQTVPLKQAVIQTLGEMCVKFSAVSSSKLVECFAMVAAHVTPELLDAFLSCSCVFISALGPRMLPFLEKVMNAVKVATAPSQENHKLCERGLSCAAALVNQMPQFVSPYLSTLMLMTCEITRTQPSIVNEVEQLQTSLALRVPMRSLLPAATKLFEELKLSEESSKIIHILTRAVRDMKKDDTLNYHRQIFQFATDTLQNISRVTGYTAMAADGNLESAVFELTTDLTLKLNENLFRPLFLKVVNVASCSKLEAQKVITYKLTNRLLDKLVSIFTPYYAYLLDLSVQLLREFQEGHVSKVLWTQTIESLRKFLMFDSEDTVTKEHCQNMLAPLVDQLSSKLDEEEIKEMSVPCLVQFGGKGVFLKDEPLLKQLNYQLLMKTRDASAKVRLGSLWTLQELYESMGDEFLVHLPETIPFMAELVEDDDERVEMECRKLITIVEGFLGESLQEHLK